MNKKEVLFGLILAAFLALVLSPFASQWPDGLEKVAEDKGFLVKGKVRPVFTSPIPDYLWPGLRNERLATAVAGVVGTIVVFCVGYSLARLIRARKSK